METDKLSEKTCTRRRVVDVKDALQSVLCVRTLKPPYYVFKQLG